MGKPEPENKRFGKNCIIAAVASFVVVICCVIIYLIFVFGLIGTSIFGAAMST